MTMVQEMIQRYKVIISMVLQLELMVAELGNSGAHDLSNSWSISEGTRHVDMSMFFSVKVQGKW